MRILLKKKYDKLILSFYLNKEAGEGRDIPFEETREQITRLRQVPEWNEKPRFLFVPNPVIKLERNVFIP